MDASEDLSPCIFNRLLSKCLSKINLNGSPLRPRLPHSSNFMMQKHLLTFIAAVLLSLPSIAQTALKSVSVDKKEADAVEVSVPSELRKYVFDMYEDVARNVSVINLSDLNADGKNDFILTIEDTGYCGSAGCLTQLLISTKSDRYVVVYSGNLYELKLQPNKSQAPRRFDVIVHSSLCNRNGSDVCEFVLELRGYELELIDWKWTMKNFGKQLMKEFTGN